MEITQVNLNHCDTAQQLLRQSTTESNCDVAIIAEPYRVPHDNGNWVTDKERIAAIQIMGRYPIQEVVDSSHEGFVIAKINGIFVCSCYAPPRWPLERFNQMLDVLIDTLIGRNPVVIAGDFNAWAVEWGSRLTNERGYSLLEALAKLEVRLCNERNVSTFRKDGRESIIDITFCSLCLMGDMNWRVSGDYTHSDHQAIQYSVGQRNPTSIHRMRSCERMWKTKYFDKDLLVESLRAASGNLNLNADQLTETVARACNASMPRRLEPRNRRRPAYWWKESLRDLRSACLRARRRVTRSRTEEDREQNKVGFSAARAALNREIKLSKLNCYKELCREADANPWGYAYWTIMAKTKGPTTPVEMCPERLKIIVDGFSRITAQRCGHQLCTMMKMTLLMLRSPAKSLNLLRKL
ncbi:uncharacterized protein LOC134206866 [Armigeres subalbatus]|uniref:uncharacterized protein LOC134206866 n=1 Tax=Armigeres subalbatus TaxID=124917 RepID=UPI002ED3FF2A